MNTLRGKAVLDCGVKATAWSSGAGSPSWEPRAICPVAVFSQRARHFLALANTYAVLVTRLLPRSVRRGPAVQPP